MEIEITKITSKGQVVIPQEIRRGAGIKEGEKFLVYETGDSVILKRISNINRSKDFEEMFNSFWKKSKEKGLTKNDVQLEIEAYRKERHARKN